MRERERVCVEWRGECVCVGGGRRVGKKREGKRKGKERHGRERNGKAKGRRGERKECVRGISGRKW